MAATHVDAVAHSTHQEVVERSRLGMLIFLASDIMLFAPFFAAYFLLRTNVQQWPPAGVHLDVPRAAIATAVLIASSFTIMVAEHQAEKNNLPRMRLWLIITMVLGAAFLVNQILEYMALNFSATSHPYGSIYWLLTGLHGAHVLTGLLAIGALALRTLRVHSAHRLTSWTVSISLLWHLVDIIWVCVFLTIWVIK